jgi:hypothetical protein
MKNLRHFAGFLALGALLGLPALAADPGGPVPGRSTSVPLAPDAPSSYSVQRGDTLWGIASKFLSQPWYWPEIWYLNPDIKNPHRIYPGDTLRLVYDADGKPQIRVERGNEVHLSPQVRALPLSEAIPAIPFEIVAAFMSKPSVIPKEESDKLPYIVAIGNNQIEAGMDDVLYARGVKDAEPGVRFNVVHIGDELKDPETHKFLGYEGIYAGRARLERAATGSGKNDLAKLVLTESARETLTGDRLVRDALDVPLDFIPHAPARPVSGQLMAVIGGTNVIGQYQVVVVNRGSRDGLEPGVVLGVWKNGESVKDRGPGGLTTSNQFKEPFAKNVQLPRELAGNFMVFKAYERLSYGLIMSASSDMHVGDLVRNP